MGDVYCDVRGGNKKTEESAVGAAGIEHRGEHDVSMCSS